MLELISGLRRAGLTIVLIEHNMRVIMGLSDRVVVLHHGEKLAEGPPEAVSRDARVMAAYLGQAAAS
jgi:branched-chain amino acid transport system ATP-binding protein